jgi:hypothetical protein
MVYEEIFKMKTIKLFTIFIITLFSNYYLYCQKNEQLFKIQKDSYNNNDGYFNLLEKLDVISRPVLNDSAKDWRISLSPKIGIFLSEYDRPRIPGPFIGFNVNIPIGNQWRFKPGFEIGRTNILIDNGNYGISYEYLFLLGHKWNHKKFSFEVDLGPSYIEGRNEDGRLNNNMLLIYISLNFGINIYDDNDLIFGIRRHFLSFPIGPGYWWNITLSSELKLF